jgi:hypothetical protein
LFFPLFQCVPIMFPNTFLKMFPTAPWFYSMWFVESSTLMYIYWKRGLWVREYTCFYFAIGVQRGALIGELPTIPKQLMMGRWIWVFQVLKKRYENTHEQFNMNHNRYEITKTSFNFVILVWTEPYGPCINKHILNMCIYCSHEIGLALLVLSNNEKLLLNRDQQGVQSYVLLK